jgi:integrase
VITQPDGTEVIHVETGYYYANYRDHDGKLRVVSTKCRDKDNAEQFLRKRQEQTERVLAGVVTKEEVKRAEIAHTTAIDSHIGDYASTLTGNKKHQKNTTDYLEKLRDTLGWATLADLQRDVLELWLANQFNVKGRSARSCNAYRIAACGFGTWLKKSKRIASNPFSELTSFDEKANPVQPRRALTADELARLMEAARNAPTTRALTGWKSGSRPARKLSGSQRADLYAFLAGTGLRINEVRELRVSDVRLDGALPGIDLRAGTTKNGEEAFIPLRDDLVSMLRRQIAGRKPSSPVFDVPVALIKRFHADCKRAGIPPQDDRGRWVVLHSLRMSFGTFLALAGVPLTVTQKLMRHQDPKLTANIYTDLRMLDLHAAVSATSKVVAQVVAQVVAPSRSPMQFPATSVHQLQNDESEKAAP